MEYLAYRTTVWSREPPNSMHAQSRFSEVYSIPRAFPIHIAQREPKLDQSIVVDNQAFVLYETFDRLRHDTQARKLWIDYMYQSIKI